MKYLERIHRIVGVAVTRGGTIIKVSRAFQAERQWGQVLKNQKLPFQDATPNVPDPKCSHKEYEEMLSRLGKIKEVWCLPKETGH